MDCRYYVKKCENDINHMCNKTFGELYRNTIARNKKIKELGYNMVTIQECEYKKTKR